MLNIVVPMAGRGQRFIDAKYSMPKPLIPVLGVPMIELVIRNLRPTIPHRFHFMIQREHDLAYGLSEALTSWAPGCSVTSVEGITEGAACTVLLSRGFINNEAPLMIANCDQYVDIDIDSYLAGLGASDGLIMTMWADDPKWSFVLRNEDGHVIQVVEKKVVSNEATVGIYTFAKGRDFVRAADSMIASGLRVNGEFYVAPVYDVLINEGARIDCFDIGMVGKGMHGIGTPADLQAFLQTDTARRAVKVGQQSSTGKHKVVTVQDTP